MLEEICLSTNFTCVVMRLKLLYLKRMLVTSTRHSYGVNIPQMYYKKSTIMYLETYSDLTEDAV